MGPAGASMKSMSLVPWLMERRTVCCVLHGEGGLEVHVAR